MLSLQVSEGGNLLSLQDKVAVVTGAASGIGRATAIKFAQAGAKVALIDLQGNDAANVKSLIEHAGGEAIVLEADVSQDEDMDIIVQQVIEKWDKIDIVFANAGINGKISPIEDLTLEDWNTTLTTNLNGTFLTVKYVVPHMKEHGGSIIITSSINGNRTFTGFGMAAYSSSKAAQMAFGKMAALELAEYNIRVNVICPGAIDTNIEENTDRDKGKLRKIEIPIHYPEGSQPLQHRPGTPEEVANLVHFLASDASNHISGTEIYIDGVESLLK